jgi:hypothetical protein
MGTEQFSPSEPFLRLWEAFVAMSRLESFEGGNASARCAIEEVVL